MAKWKSVETRWYEDRDALFRGIQRLDRRGFLRVSLAAAGAAAVSGVRFAPHSFQTVSVVDAKEAREPFSFAYISDTHLYKRELNDRFVRSLLRAIDDVNSMDPQPDFVLFGGDLAQLGQREELDLGAQLLLNVKAPVRMMVGEHDWFLDMGARWRELFGPETYSFDHKGVHFVVLQSVNEADFWTRRGMTPMERMLTVAGLDNGVQSRFEVGAPQREWLKNDLSRYDDDTPIIVFSHSPLYKYYRNWNFWTEDAEEVQAILRGFDRVTVIHGHTHQMLTNRVGNIHFHGMLSTAWPWPYAPEGLPKLTVQMARPDPFNPNDGCGDGFATVTADGLVDKVYNLWNRNPVDVPSAYLASNGKRSRPQDPTLTSF